MVKRNIWVLATTLLFSLCHNAIAFTWRHAAASSQYHNRPVHKVNHSQDPFNSIVANGGMDLDIFVGSPNRIKIQGLHSNLITKVSGNTLFLSPPNATSSQKANFLKNCQGFNGIRPHVSIWLPYLRKLNYTGAGQIHIYGSARNSIDLDIMGRGNVYIAGRNYIIHKLVAHGYGVLHVANAQGRNLWVRKLNSIKVLMQGSFELRRLYFSGSRCISICGINSCRVDVRGSGGAMAFLTGGVQSAYLRVGQKAYLDAKRLFAKRVYVQAEGISRVDVWGSYVIDAWALDHSDIRYYHPPQFLGDHMQSDGAVINMTGLDPFCKERVQMYAYSDKWHDCFGGCESGY